MQCFCRLLVVAFEILNLLTLHIYAFYPKLIQYSKLMNHYDHIRHYRPHFRLIHTSGVFFSSLWINNLLEMHFFLLEKVLLSTMMVKIIRLQYHVVVLFLLTMHCSSTILPYCYYYQYVFISISFKVLQAYSLRTLINESIIRKWLLKS